MRFVWPTSVNVDEASGLFKRALSADDEAVTFAVWEYAASCCHVRAFGTAHFIACEI